MNYEMFREMIGARRKSFAFLAFLAVLNLALLLYLSVWQEPELEKAQNDWLAGRAAAAGAQSAGTATRYRNGVRDLELFQQRVIPKKEFAGFLSQLFETARSNSLSIKSISYLPVPAKDQGMASYGVDFSVSGRYASVKSFIGDLARYSKLVTLDSLSLSGESQTEEVVDLKVRMTVYLKAEGA